MPNGALHRIIKSRLGGRPQGNANRGADLAEDKLSKLVELAARLRGPDGCPWDRAQDYDSVKGLMLEEAYEVVDAVAARDFDGLAEELGDLLFQVVFYSRLAEEEGRFALDDVIERLHDKLVRRHPHVFGPTRARTAEEALKSWNNAKAAERESKAEARPGSATERTARSVLDGIAPVLPSTLEAQELGVRAASAGFDWPRVEDLLDKIEEEVGELREELRRGQSRKAQQAQRVEEEVGDLMFAVTNLARFLRFDAESALRRANHKFRRRFQELEREAGRQGKRLTELSAVELDTLWNAAKARE